MVLSHESVVITDVQQNLDASPAQKIIVYFKILTMIRGTKLAIRKLSRKVHDRASKGKYCTVSEIDRIKVVSG